MNTDLQQTLLELFQHIHSNPDYIPDVPVDAWQEGSVERQVLSSFRGVLERFQQSRQDAQKREEQLHEKEAQYRSIFEATSDGLLISDLEDGHIVEANPAICQMNGYTREELLVLPPANLIAPEYHYLVAESLQTIKQGGQFYNQAVALRKDGTTFLSESRGNTFMYKGKPHILTISRDITQRVQAEEQLREKEAEYRSIFEATSDALVIISFENGQIVEANPAACKIYGYDYEEFIGSSATITSHPDDLPYIVKNVIPIIRAGGEFHGQARGLHKDGTTFHLDIRDTSFIYQGKPHILAVVRDITELVQANQLLEQRVEERTRELSTLLEVSHNVASMIELFPLLELILDQLQKLVPYAGASILLVDGDDLEIVYYRGLWAYPDERLQNRRYSLQETIKLGLPLTPFVLDDAMDDSPLSRRFREINHDIPEIDTGAIRSWMHVPLMLKEKLIGFFQISSSEPYYYTSEHVKITQAIANQAAVAIENARLYEQAQQLAALEERQRLARELHDSVSQALYGIILGTHTARVLLDRDPSQIAEPLNYVLSLSEAALAEMRALIFELRPESLEAQGLVVALTKQGTALQARHNIAVSLDLCEEPTASLKVKQELYRVAQEALHNIVKHASASKAEILLACETESILLRISDNGRGFATDGAFPGHLGLRSMRERVSKLRGRLQIESQLGAGTSICVWTPTR